MAQPNTPINVPKQSQEGILAFHRQCYNMLNQTWNIRAQFRTIDLAYLRETDWTVENKRAQLANKYGDSNKFQNVTVPVVMPQVEAAVTYQTSVFLTGNPIFGVVASPMFEDEAIQMESIIDDQAVRGGWVRQLMMFFRDGNKYNYSAVEVDWCREVTATLETNLDFSPKQAKPKEVIWEGNRIRRLDPYNTFFDARVPLTEMHTKGEFAGYTELMSRVQLKEFINKLPDKMIENVKAAFESGLGAAVGGFSSGGIESYYIPQLNPDAIINKNPRATTDWMAWAGVTGAVEDGIKINYKNLYEVTTLYGRIIPSDFGLRVPAVNTPQIWKFVIVNHQVLIYAERQTNAHGYIPIIFGQPQEDGLMYQSKSLANNVKPFQDVASALMNSLIASRRRAISDRVIYDPSRISEHHINSDNPSAKIPVRPKAYGGNVAEAVYAFPFRDDQAPVITQEIQQMNAMANVVSGHNQAQQGQFVKGNKTLHEYSDVMAHANGRDQMTALLYEDQVFTPLKLILKTNILQYQGGVSLFNREKQAVVNIDPIKLRKAVLEFKVSDGLIPTDKQIGADAFQTSLQVLGSSPQIAAEYNIGPMFSYLMKTQGADLKPFEKSKEQLAYEQAVMQWQQAVQMVASNLKGIDPAQAQELLKQLPPQPVPQQFGYNPNQQGASISSPAQTEVATRINNITNNISTQGE